MVWCKGMLMTQIFMNFLQQLIALNLPFLLNFQTNDSFSERTRGTLYSALIHSKTSNLEVKLELPELSSRYDLRCCTVHIYSILYNNAC